MTFPARFWQPLPVGPLVCGRVKPREEPFELDVPVGERRKGRELSLLSLARWFAYVTPVLQSLGANNEMGM